MPPRRHPPEPADGARVPQAPSIGARVPQAPNACAPHLGCVCHKPRLSGPVGHKPQTPARISPRVPPLSHPPLSHPPPALPRPGLPRPGLPRPGLPRPGLPRRWLDGISNINGAEGPVAWRRASRVQRGQLSRAGGCSLTGVQGPWPIVGYRWLAPRLLGGGGCGAGVAPGTFRWRRDPGVVVRGW